MFNFNFGGATLTPEQENILNQVENRGFPKRKLTNHEYQLLKQIQKKYKIHQDYVTNNCKGNNLTKREYLEHPLDYCKRLDKCIYESAQEANERYNAYMMFPDATFDKNHLAQLYYSMNTSNRYKDWYKKDCSSTRNTNYLRPELINQFDPLEYYYSKYQHQQQHHHQKENENKRKGKGKRKRKMTTIYVNCKRKR